jgi:PAS domain S-box-containing protein
LACAIAALAIRALFAPSLAVAPFLTSTLAVIAVARYLGARAAVFTIAICCAGSALLWPVDWLRFATFAAVAAVIVWVIESIRIAHEYAERNAELAKNRLAQLQEEIAKRADEERISAQLRTIVETSDDAVISKNLDSIIQSWNRAAEEIFGYTSAEAVGRPMQILLPPDRLHEESNIIEQIRAGGRVKHFDTVRVRKDGRRIHVSLTVSPMRDARGEIIGVSHIARDISERKEFESQMRETQKLESLGVLAGGLAHDFNNLLTGVMGNASLASQELSQPERARERLDEILQASERAALLVRQMLAYAGKGRFLLERLDLSAQVREILPLLQTSISKMVRIELGLAEHLPPVEADRSQIQQVIMNLTLNAAEAIEDRPGVVTITTSTLEHEGERQVALEVEDTGSGMTEETKARIFDPFFTTKFTGRGLGLAAVTGIVRAHRGAISVASRVGEGTKFTVTLPATSGSITAAAEPPEGELRGEGLVLVADDEELVRNMARVTLERYGYRVEMAADGREALDRFRARPQAFAAVLLDLTMPEMTGEEVLRSIRGVRVDLPVVLSSGYTESEAMKRFHDLGVAGFLQKPYKATTLAQKIKQALGGVRA